MDEVLKILDISEEQYLIYKEILNGDDSNLVSLAKKVSLSRATLYSHLKSLEEKGLINRAFGDPRKKYSASPPEKLIELFDQKVNDLKSTKAGLIRQVKYLEEASESATDRGDAEFQIIRGKSINDKLDQFIIDKNKPLCGITYAYHVTSCFDFDKKGNLKANEYLELLQKVTDKFIFPGNKKNIAEVKRLFDRNPFLKDIWFPRFIPEKEFKFKVNFYVFDKYIAFGLGNHDEPDYLSYILKNSEIADSMRALVNYLWEKATPI